MLAALPLLFSLAAPQPALAAPQGILVRVLLDRIPEQQPSLELTPEGGEGTVISLNDDGQSPDVVAGDQSFAGSAVLDGDSFNVSLIVDGQALDGGTVTWEVDGQLRDLDVQLNGTTVTATAQISVPGAAPDGQVGGSTVGVLPGVATIPGAPGGLAGGADTDQLDDGVLLVATGACLLVLLGLAWWTMVFRAGPGSAPGVYRGVFRQPEAGLFGPGTPSLSEDLALWVVSAEAEAELLPLLMKTLTRRHRVLVVPREGHQVPAAAGRGVYLADGVKPAAIGGSAEALLGVPPRPVAVLVLAEKRPKEKWQDYEDLLPEGIGGVVIVRAPEDTELPIVHCARDGEHWRLQSGDVTVRVGPGPDGLVPVASA